MAKGINQDQTKMIIRKSEEFAVDGLGRITVYTAIDPDMATSLGEAVALYEGYATIGAPTSDGRVMQIPVNFVIPDVKTIQEAFSKFEELATIRFKQVIEEVRHQAEAEQNRIVTARSMPNIQIAK